MANPFLFDCPPPAAEANPFLADVAPPLNQPQQPPNPFLAETLQQVPPSSTHSQQAYYNGGSSNMAANPFATDAYSAQPQQQYYGHYGQFPQMHSYGVAQHPPPPDSNLVGAAAFGVVSHEPVHELPQKSPHELMTEIPNEPPQEYIKEIPQKPPQEFVKEIPKELPQQVIKEVTKEPPQEILGEPSQKSSMNVLPEIRKEIPSEISKQISNEIPQDIINEIPQASTELQKEPSPPPPPPPTAITCSNVFPEVEMPKSIEENGDEIINFEEQKCQIIEKVEEIKIEEKDISIEKNDESDTKAGESSGFSRIFTNESSIDETKSEEQTIPEENVIEISKEEVTMKDASDIIKEEKGNEENESKHLEDTSVGTSLFGTCTEETEKKLDLTAAAYGDDEEVKDVEILLNQKSAPLLEQQIAQEETTLKMTTGDAIFADLPPMPNLNSTGASIFGVSEEAALDSTGATLFGVHAPREARPELGAMTGWDDAFDQKFNLADVGNVAKPGDPFDPFITSEGAVPSNDPFGVGEVTVNKVEGFGYDDGFSKAKSITAVKNTEENPFLETLEPPEDEPLFDDDTSQPLEPFPRLDYSADGWEMFLRHPPKKKLTSQRFWKKCYVRLAMQGDNPAVVLFESKDSKDPFQELPLQSAYSVSDISHQVFDQYSKIFTLKLQYIFYKERAGIRPGQMTKMQKLTGKIGFLAKAVEEADYEGVKEFASDMKKLGVPLEHAPQISELLKLGSYSFEDLKQFTVSIEEKLFGMDIHRDRSLTYKTEEVQLTAVDELYVEQDKNWKILKQLARVRVFFCSFLTGMPDVELGVNDMERMGLEVVGRHDILPVPTEQWIRYEDIEFHSVIDKKAFESEDHIIKFQPPDACYLELMRFRVRPPRSRELPLLARCNFEITGNNVIIKADMLIPYHHTKAWGQVPCDDVSMRIPLPECWIYQFRTEKHHLSLSQIATGSLNLSTRMGSVKSAHRRAGKVKGLERFLGTMETHSQELMETSSGQAKYEHQHKAIVWRVPRLPKHGQGSYTTHEFICKLQLTSFDQMPEQFEKNFYVEFTQPATAVSHTVLRSVSVSGGSGEPPEKFVKYLARHEYKLEIEFSEKEQNTYMQAAQKKPQTESKTPQHNPDAYIGQPEFPDDPAICNKDSDTDSD
ncbi:uncharacterized protein stnB [Lepeophtheirus salmonis]|uniref:uncharacterized protein stnB n=1 Tax=Lepeophtheirus salmonis TaxID=72036 RepID=UPI001AE821F8|nr:putative stoned B-like protein [Lepeophtheirus salmonis]